MQALEKDSIRTKRVYDPPGSSDGLRILVDRIWPRGVKKEDAQVVHWMKELAPSDELRGWFGHDPARWEEFQQRYFAELDQNPEPLARLRELLREGPVTLVYAAKDEQHNNAVALRAYLLSREG